MAFLTAADHGVDVQSAGGGWNRGKRRECAGQGGGLPQVEARIEGENFAVARAASDGAVSGGLPGECSSGFRGSGHRILRRNIRSTGWRREGREQSECRWRAPEEPGGSGEKPWLDFSFPELHKAGGGAIGIAKNGEGGIEAAIGDVDAAVNHVEIVGIVDAAQESTTDVLGSLPMRQVPA